MEYRLTIKELPPEERPRERLLARGAPALTDAELLAIVLRTGSRHETAVGLAQRLLAGGGLPELVLARPHQLARTRGMGLVKAAQVHAALELGRRFAAGSTERTVVRCPEDAARRLLPVMCNLDKEQFQVMLLNTKNHVLGVELVSLGDLNSSVVHPREIFKPAVIRSAYAVILAHNHPSGDPEPSPEDLAVTRRLVDAGRLLGIEVLDHLVIGNGKWSSIRQCLASAWAP